jgi:hypothetical protein
MEILCRQMLYDLPMESASSLMDEIRERVQALESNLPKQLDAMDVSRTAKLPWKALFYRESLIWRMTELGRAAVENLERDRLVSAIVLIRAAVETSAALWYLWGKIAAAVESNALGDIDTYLMRLISGVKLTDDATFPQAINILTFLESVEKEVEGFSHQYAVLCEYAHPNSSGTSQSYVQHDREQLTTSFGQNTRTADNTRMIGLINLSVSLLMFEVKYKCITELIPAFTTLCENQLKQRASGGAADP